MAQKTDSPMDIGLTSRKKVLVAEDEQNIASLLEDWLSESFEVILANNGASAFQKAKWNKPDIILLDVMMPDMGGYEVVCALQGDPITAKTPVIVMTAKNFDDSTIKLIKAEPNVFGFLNKPFKPEELKKQVLQSMSGQRSFAPTSSRRPAVAPAPAAPAPVPVAVPQVPPTPAVVLAPPPGPPVPMAPPTPPAPFPAAPTLMPIPQVPPTPAVVLSPPPPPRAPAPTPMPEVMHGFPEIVPTSPIPAAAAPVAPPAVAPGAPPPLPPFLKPSHMPPVTPPPSVPARPAPPPPPPSLPRASAPASAPAQNPLIEPISALPPEPMEPPPLLSPMVPPLEPPAPPRPPVPAPRAARAPKPPVLPSEDEDSVGAGSAATVQLAFWACKAVAKAGVFIIGVLAAAEISCRWTEKALQAEVFVPRFRPARSADLPYLFPANGGWTLDGIEYAINEWGVRSGNIDLLKPANTVRILLLGGTSLFGEGAPAAETVASRLEALLRAEKGRFKVEVINGGVWGYSPEEQWNFYEAEMAQLKPDAVVWLCEDRVGGFPSSIKLREMAQESWLAARMFKNSHLARLLMRRELEEGTASVRPTDFLAALQPALKAMRENETPFLYAVFPDRQLENSEWRELPEAQRIDMDGAVRKDYLSRTSSSRRDVAAAVAERLKAMKLSPSEK